MHVEEVGKTPFRSSPKHDHADIRKQQNWNTASEIKVESNFC